MSVEFEIENQQEVISMPESWLEAFREIAGKAHQSALDAKISPADVLSELEFVEITFVDDETSDRVHRDFMDISGATDVITFHHGEIIIGAEVAARQAAEFNEPIGRELLRYIIHGLLHLSGHEDADAEDRKVMESAQEKIVSALWSDVLAEKLS